MRHKSHGANHLPSLNTSARCLKIKAVQKSNYRIEDLCLKGRHVFFPTATFQTVTFPTRFSRLYQFPDLQVPRNYDFPDFNFPD
jgi:hypothetical protein